MGRSGPVALSSKAANDGPSSSDVESHDDQRRPTGKRYPSRGSPSLGPLAVDGMRVVRQDADGMAMENAFRWAAARYSAVSAPVGLLSLSVARNETS